MRAHHPTLIAPLALVALALTACGGAGKVPQVNGTEAAAPTVGGAPSASASVSSGPSKDDLTRFFKALSDSDASEIKPVIRLTSPGSVAEAYAKHEFNVAQAALQGGNPYDTATFSEVDGRYKTCDGSGNDQSCLVWGNVRAQGDKIASFTLNGKPLKGRIVLGSGKKVPLGSLGSVKLLTAYNSVQSGSLFVTAKVSAADQKIDMDYQTAYLGPAGAQSTVTEIDGPASLLPHASAYYSFVFKGVPIGGKLILQVDEDGGSYGQASATLATRR